MHYKKANKFEERKLDSSYPILKETPNLLFQRAGHFSVFRHYATYREKKVFNKFFENNFFKNFKIFSF